MRKLTKDDLLGKTIESVDVESVNVLKLTFTDGTSLELWVEAVGYGLYGILVDEKG